MGCDQLRTDRQGGLDLHHLTQTEPVGMTTPATARNEMGSHQARFGPRTGKAWGLDEVCKTGRQSEQG
jgi:hypothetical protein